ncbi:MAG: hypothetical protein K6G08_09675, partial [Prevotella sp.]|nr:hypothetical protein [Prevotella sp.]
AVQPSVATVVRPSEETAVAETSGAVASKKKLSRNSIIMSVVSVLMMVMTILFFVDTYAEEYMYSTMDPCGSYFSTYDTDNANKKYEWMRSVTGRKGFMEFNRYFKHEQIIYEAGTLDDIGKHDEYSRMVENNWRNSINQVIGQSRTQLMVVFLLSAVSLFCCRWEKWQFIAFFLALAAFAANLIWLIKPS